MAFDGSNQASGSFLLLCFQGIGQSPWSRYYFLQVQFKTVHSGSGWSPMQTGFGWIKIGDVTYEHDIIIHTDGAVTKRRKKRSRDLKEQYGHTPLSEHELDLLAEEHPDVVYIGTGQYGSLPITPEAKKLLLDYHTVILPTPELMIKIGQEERHGLAIIHVTC